MPSGRPAPAGVDIQNDAPIKPSGKRERKMTVAVQISAGQGPAECRLFAAFVHRTILQEASDAGFNANEDKMTRADVGLKSAVIVLEAALEQVRPLNWEGTWQWICKSPLRPHHGRRNWFIAVSIQEEVEKALHEKEAIRYFVCRSGGHGGQNVNRRNTAVRAVDERTGLSVRIEDERSFFRNRSKARTLLAKKLQDEARRNALSEEENRHAGLYRLERGNAVRVYKGDAFAPGLVIV